MFEQMLKALSERVENLFKIGKYTNVKGKDGQFQEIQIQTLRNIEDAIKVGQFGFNSKAPIGSRRVVIRVGNESIIIANEHTASIIDINSGDAIVYNQSGTYMKLVGDNVEVKCTKMIVDADLEVTGDVTADGEVTAGTIELTTHTHTQPNDSNGDTQSPTNVPTP